SLTLPARHFAQLAPAAQPAVSLIPESSPTPDLSWGSFSHRSRRIEQQSPQRGFRQQEVHHGPLDSSLARGPGSAAAAGRCPTRLRPGRGGIAPGVLSASGRLVLRPAGRVLLRRADRQLLRGAGGTLLRSAGGIVLRAGPGRLVLRAGPGRDDL